MTRRTLLLSRFWMGTGTASSRSCGAFRGRPRSRSASAMPIPASTTTARKADWKPSFSTTSGFASSFAAGSPRSGRSAARPSKEQAAEGEPVGAQHPLQALLREAEVGSDRGQRHEDDRAVEDHHEESAAEERKRPSTPGIECIQHVASTSLCGRDQRVAARLHESSWSPFSRCAR